MLGCFVCHVLYSPGIVATVVLGFNSSSAMSSSNGTSLASSISSAVSSVIAADVASPTGQLQNSLGAAPNLTAVIVIGEV